MELNSLYGLRRNFSIIAVTGRKGSGCSKFAELLSSEFDDLKIGLRNPEEIQDHLFRKKYAICYKFISHPSNWNKYEIIEYKRVIIFFLISVIRNEEDLKRLLVESYRGISETQESSNEHIDKLIIAITALNKKFPKTIRSILKYNGNFSKIRSDRKLDRLHKDYFGKNFNNYCNALLKYLAMSSYSKRTLLLTRVASNIRKNGTPFESTDADLKNIYTISQLINRIIKAKKRYNDSLEVEKPTHIVIDSLRNSLEIMFFKERYSAFYMTSISNGSTSAYNRIFDRLVKSKYSESEAKKITTELIKLDNIESRTNDFSKGNFYSPDVQNCIQKCDVHLINRKSTDIVYSDEVSSDFDNFYSREEQIIKLVSLIYQPGILTPSSVERCMHIAHTAKSNSGCISRQVGAVITNTQFSIQSIGWNDVASGNTPCNLRNVKDYFDNSLNERDYSDFERAVNIESTEYNYKEKEVGDFKMAIKDHYGPQEVKIKDNFEGKNCSFCFKSIHNKYEGEKNQVHTRSLHAEENAMLQIAKYGGHSLKEGILFTTASPCELCAKKAYQLSIDKIYFIDPYPGISKTQILTSGSHISRPQMYPFNGIIGKSYHKLYEPFMSYKDELNLMLT
jgi:deoxycytidylate deaminase